MSGQSLDEVLTPTGTIPAGWEQGRGAFGGLVLGLMTRAAEAAAADPSRRLRALAGEIVGPVVAGPAAITTEILRAGTGATTVEVRLSQDGNVQAHAAAVFGKARATYQAAPVLEPPALPPWREVAPITPPAPPAPLFTRHIEFRPITGIPFSGGDGREVTGWMRFRTPARVRDAAWMVAMVDTWWPAMLAAATTPRAAATLTFAFELLGTLDERDPIDEPLAYRARVLAGADGYALEARELWTGDGRLLALNQQTFVMMT